MEKVSSKSEFNLQTKDRTKGFLLFLFLLYYTVKQLLFTFKELFQEQSENCMEKKNKLLTHMPVP